MFRKENSFATQVDKNFPWAQHQQIMEVDTTTVRHHGQVVPIFNIAASKGKRRWMFLRSLAKALWPGTTDTSAATYALQELGLERSVVMHMTRDHPGLSDDDWQTMQAESSYKASLGLVELNNNTKRLNYD